MKDTAVLEAAYNDSRGVTAEFNRNILNVINRHLDGDFDPGAFEHVAYYNVEKERIESYLRSSEGAGRPPRSDRSRGVVREGRVAVDRGLVQVHEIVRREATRIRGLCRWSTGSTTTTQPSRSPSPVLAVLAEGEGALADLG